MRLRLGGGCILLGGVAVFGFILTVVLLSSQKGHCPVITKGAESRVVHVHQPCPSPAPSGKLEMRETLTVALLTSGEHINMADRAFTSWASSAQHIQLFVGEDCDHRSSTGLPLVKLPGVSDSSVNSVTKTFRVVEYLIENYVESSQWFLLVSHNTYVRLHKLESLLHSLDSSALVYLGYPGSGRDRDKLGLLPHERYCLGSSGVVLSRALLLSLRDHLSSCSSPPGASGGTPGTEWPDVELGRCISRTLDTQCSPELKEMFVTDLREGAVSAVQSSKFDPIITYHPIHSTEELDALHNYYTRRELTVAMSKVDELQEALECSDCTPLCKCPSLPDKCPAADNVYSSPKPYQPTTINDYQSWTYFDDRTLYTDKTVVPNSNLQSSKHLRKELQVMLSKAVASASESYGRHLKFKKLLNGWVRHNPFKGSEYIVDCLFVDNYMRTVEQRVSLLRPLASNYITVPETAVPGAVVHFIVPLSNVNNRFQEFLRSYELIEAHEKVKLVLVVYGSESVSQVKAQVSQYQVAHPDSLILVVEGKGKFARGKALHLGMSQLQAKDLAFICDVDMTVAEGFVDRCRKNTIQGKRVYYPEFFKLYNLDYVYRKGNYPSKVLPRRKHGHWAYYSFGMLCIYKSDYSSAGGMNTNIVGWGEEDVKFFEKVVRKKLEVLRAPDIGLSHRWHQKNCPASLAKVQHEHCLSSRAENLADRMDLANYIFEMKVDLKSSHKVELLPDNFTLDENYLND